MLCILILSVVVLHSEIGGPTVVPRAYASLNQGLCILSFH